jgi:hypothetical protein
MAPIAAVVRSGGIAPRPKSRPGTIPENPGGPVGAGPVGGGPVGGGPAIGLRPGGDPVAGPVGGGPVAGPVGGGPVAGPVGGGPVAGPVGGGPVAGPVGGGPVGGGPVGGAPVGGGPVGGGPVGGGPVGGGPVGGGPVGGGPVGGGPVAGSPVSGGPLSVGVGSPSGYYVDPSFSSAVTGGFMNLLQNATSPDALNAQSIILRRIALEGDVVGSRVPPPRNITEIGGYLNYLTQINQPEMRSQALAGILGVAGPNPPLGWLSAGEPQLTFLRLPNDRPAGPAQATTPLSIVVRSDFADAFKAALANLHDQGCSLPLQSGPTTLPLAAPGAIVPVDLLPFLGRALDIAPGVALGNPTTDPIALVRPAGTAGAYALAARVVWPGTVPVAAANYDAVQCTASSSATVLLAAAKFVLLATPLHAAGFYEVAPLPMATSLSSTGWAHLTNITGLVRGKTQLGDELSLLYRWADIQNSVFAGSLNLVWDGAMFSMP